MELVDITDRVAGAIRDAGEAAAAWLVYVPHTTAGVTINEGADPAVARDLLMAWRRLVPDDLAYEHREGNAPSHVLASLAGSSVTVPVDEGGPALGTWQAIFLCEFDGPRTRTVRVSPIPSG